MNEGHGLMVMLTTNNRNKECDQPTGTSSALNLS